MKIPIIYTGRIDLPLIEDGQTWILDHKTTSMMGPSFFDSLKKSGQFKGYRWAFEQLTGTPTAGHIINAIRTRESIKQYAKESDRVFAARKEEWWSESLQRERFYAQAGDLEEWKQNTIELINTFFYHYQQGYFPMQTSWCCGKYGKCQFFDVCDLKSADRGLLLESGLFQDNTFSPLKQPKTIA